MTIRKLLAKAFDGYAREDREGEAIIWKPADIIRDALIRAGWNKERRESGIVWTKVVGGLKAAVVVEPAHWAATRVRPAA